jgi:hypothetical protein
LLFHRPYPIRERHGGAFFITKGQAMTTMQATMKVTEQARAATKELIRDYQIIDSAGSNYPRRAFEAIERRSGEKVVLKLLPWAPFVAKDWSALRERLSMLQTARANVVQVLSVGEAGTPTGLPIRYATTRHVGGPDLSIAGGPTTVEQAARWAADALAGLRQYHERGLAHGAVTAEHLLLTPTGDVQLLPTGGIATTSISSATRAGDLRQFGETLLFLLSGRRDLSTAELSELRPEVPRCFTAWLKRLTADRFNDQFSGATNALSALTRMRLI